MKVKTQLKAGTTTQTNTASVSQSTSSGNLSLNVLALQANQAYSVASVTQSNSIYLDF